MKLKYFLPALFMGSTAMAAPTLTTKIHNQYTSLRALGMGNAFTALADDYSLIHYNPAGFASNTRREIQVNIANIAYAPKTSDFIKEISDAEKSADNDTDKANAISDVLEKYYGETMGGRTQLLEFSWIHKNWGISLIPVDLTVNMTVDKQVGPSVDLYAIKDTTFAFGYGSKITDDLSWGITSKFIHRLEVDERLIAIDLAADSDLISEDRAKEGTALDFDLGFIFNVPWLEKRYKIRTVKSNAPLNPKNNSKPSENVNSPSDALPDESSDSQAQAQTDEPSDSPTQIQSEPELMTEGKYPLSLAVVVRNILGSNFSKQTWVNKDAIYEPKGLHTLIDVGSAFDFYQKESTTLRSLIDIKNINHPEISFKKSLHIGLEYDYSPSSWFQTQFRAGFNQSYWTAGFSFNLSVLQIEAATYGEEVGTETYKKENRVYAAKLGMNF